MDKRDYELSMQLMTEMGFEEGDRRRVIDQDTGMVCRMGSKEIVTPGAQSGRSAIEFDPAGNPRLMSVIFGGYLQKLEAEDEIPHCSGFSTYGKPGEDMRARVVFGDGQVMVSNSYKNESLCLIELVHRINGDDEKTFTEYDYDRRKAAPITPVKKKMRDDKPARKKKGETA